MNDWDRAERQYLEPPDDPEGSNQKCEDCKGKGFVVMDVGDLLNKEEDCEACDATGYVFVSAASQRKALAEDKDDYMRQIQKDRKLENENE